MKRVTAIERESLTAHRPAERTVTSCTATHNGGTPIVWHPDKRSERKTK